VTDPHDKAKNTLKLVTTQIDLGHLTKEFASMRLATLDSSAMRAIEEQSKRNQELMASISGRLSATACSNGDAQGWKYC